MGNPRRGLAVGAMLVLVLGIVPGVRAEQARYNLHLELGPIFNLQQPVQSSADQELARTGAHLRGAFEFEPHERVGVEVAYGADIQALRVRATLAGQQSFSGGLRVRPWYRREGGFLVGARRSTGAAAPEGGSLSRLLSDVWLDAHAGVSFADRTRVYYDVGAGFRFPVVAPIQLGLVLRWQQLIAPGVAERDFKQLVLAVVLSAGFRPVHRPRDGDHDGVPDSDDQCPDSPPRARVNEAGCPVADDAPPVEGPPPCSDTDLDGVCDGQDRCPDTPLGTPVDDSGCAVGTPQEELPAPEPR